MLQSGKGGCHDLELELPEKNYKQQTLPRTAKFGTFDKKETPSRAEIVTRAANAIVQGLEVSEKSHASMGLAAKLRMSANAAFLVGAWACVALGGAFLIFENDKSFSRVMSEYLEIEGLHHSALAVGLLVVFTAFGGVFVAGHLALRRSKPGAARCRRCSTWTWRMVEVPFFGRMALAEITLMLAWILLQSITMMQYFIKLKEHHSSHGEGMTTKTILMGLCCMFGIGFGVNLAVLMLPVSKHSFWLELLDVGFERAVRVHRWIGVLVMTLIVLHALFAVLTYIHVESLAYCMGWSSVSPGDDAYCQPVLVKINIYGEIAFAGGILLSVTSLPAVRRFSYQLFYYSHVIGAVLFFGFGIIHFSSTLTYFLPGLATYVADKVISTWRRARSCLLLHYSVNDETDCTKLEIALDQDTPLPRQGHWYHVNVKEASVLQWHPMSVAETNAEEHSIVFYIRHDGDWSSRLGSVARARALQQEGLTVRLDGPFGGTHTRHSGYMNNDAAIFVCGGIGITAHALAVEAAVASDCFQLVALRWFVTKKAFLDQHTAVLERLAGMGADVQVHITRGADVEREASLQPATRWSESSLLRRSRWRYATNLDSGIAKAIVTAAAALSLVGALRSQGTKNPGHHHHDHTQENFFLEHAKNLTFIVGMCVLITVAVAIKFSIVTKALRILCPDKMFRAWTRVAKKLSLSDAELALPSPDPLERQRFLIDGGSLPSTPASGELLSVSYGRPRLEDVFAELASNLEERSTGIRLAGVSLCGPERLVNGSILAANTMSNNSTVSFIIDEEEYSF
ncbi:Ferric reduction oxidase 2 [Hondaea fermentalgiana]|uniref:Ferric reduction oxidase 2 n=1 Tax=Hondaea fermentalgiana TaxID=2315210 RepID=A0A2R5GAJ7_9STRA|nr:Ferric reduction oxidase 2 [Hondaea fermentalgiana]|eukprot:GBG25111.1 Ferric reduction oxidase 2 [Hondaea fermentalgiana]